MKRKIERVEHAEQREQDDQPEHADRDPLLDVERLAGAFANAQIDGEQFEQAHHAGAREHRDHPADDQYSKRAEYFGQVRNQGVLQRVDQSREIHDASLADDLNVAGREYTSLPRSGARIA